MYCTALLYIFLAKTSIVISILLESTGNQESILLARWAGHPHLPQQPDQSTLRICHSPLCSGYDFGGSHGVLFSFRDLQVLIFGKSTKKSIFNSFLLLYWLQIHWFWFSIANIHCITCLFFFYVLRMKLVPSKILKNNTNSIWNNVLHQFIHLCA